MSIEDKVCCNCRHNIRHYEDKGGACYCDIDNHYIGYVQCMEERCKHWSKEQQPVKHKITNEDLHREKEQAYYLGYEAGRKSLLDGLVKMKGGETNEND